MPKKSLGIITNFIYMKVIAGYRYYTSEEQDKWCKKHGVPPVHWTLKQWRNQRTESGYPVLGPYYNRNF